MSGRVGNSNLEFGIWNLEFVRAFQIPNSYFQIPKTFSSS
jgi:hypothetical protein